MSVAHITHFDLDGVVSGIFAKKTFDIDFTKCCGYAKVDAKLDECIASGRRELVVTDLNFTTEQVQKAIEHFDKVYYFDHHEGSEEHYPFAEQYPDKFIYRYSSKLSGTALMYQYYLKEGKGSTNADESRLAILADTYDMWRKDSDKWDDAYALNDLFWRYNFWEFEKKFEDGFRDFTFEEKQYCDSIKKRRRDIIDSAPREVLDNDTLILMIEDRDAIAEVTLYETDYKLFIIIHRHDDAYQISVRSAVDKIDDDIIDINKALNKTVEREPKLINGGGHKMAGGACFTPESNIGDVLRVAKGTLYSNLLPIRYFDTDIPF